MILGAQVYGAADGWPNIKVDLPNTLVVAPVGWAARGVQVSVEARRRWHVVDSALSN